MLQCVLCIPKTGTPYYLILVNQKFAFKIKKAQTLGRYTAIQIRIISSGGGGAGGKSDQLT